ncbi:hypothetical protein L6452_14625 [Arctium lappa]|uniref:Uncharacterized protein n=1 Tax=Arctium lappa TaxID=4217 RepID=A0ACB9CLJ5_ARCLA|nr:hypothetical protein L6452_14625 [Arctium lappa]
MLSAEKKGTGIIKSNENVESANTDKDKASVLNVDKGKQPEVGSSRNSQLETFASFPASDFDLGISPTKTQSEATKESNKEGHDEEDGTEQVAKRSKRLGPLFRSPYVKRSVGFEVTKDETNLRNWVLRGIGGIMEIMFLD